MTDWHFAENHAYPLTTEEIIALFMDFRPSWHMKAECRGETKRMYPEHTRGKTPNWGSAAYICKRCSVQEQCLTYAIANDETDGMWGGLTPAERAVASNEKTAEGTE